MNKAQFINILEECSKQGYVDNPNFSITKSDFSKIIIEHFLGPDWGVVDPISGNQVLAIACEEILFNNKHSYRERYKKIIKSKWFKKSYHNISTEL